MKKHFFNSIIILFLLQFCNKELYAQYSNIIDFIYNHRVLYYLNHNIDSEDFKRIDIENAYYLKEDEKIEKNHYFLRVPIVDQPIQTDFIALETDTTGKVMKGAYVHIGKHNQTIPDTVIIYNLLKTKKWIINPLSNKFDSSSKIKKILDAVIIIGIVPDEINKTTKYNIYLNVYAILNPDKLEYTLEPGMGGYGIRPIEVLNNGGQTNSFYFDIDLEKKNYMEPILNKLKFEHPENLPAMDIKKAFQ